MGTFTRVIIILMYMIVYVYSVYKTTVCSDVIWGWICTFIFGLGAIWGVNAIVKNNRENKEE